MVLTSPPQNRSREPTLRMRLVHSFYLGLYYYETGDPLKTLFVKPSLSHFNMVSKRVFTEPLNVLVTMMNDNWCASLCIFYQSLQQVGSFYSCVYQFE